MLFFQRLHRAREYQMRQVSIGKLVNTLQARDWPKKLHHLMGRGSDYVFFYRLRFTVSMELKNAVKGSTHQEQSSISISKEKNIVILLGTDTV